jgi:hypothetical protein
MKKNYSIKKAFVLFAAILFGMASMQAATISVSSATEVAGVNYNTIQAAYNYIQGVGNATPISEAYTIEVQATYAGELAYPIMLTPVAGASATNTITIKPATGAAVVIANPTVTATVNKTIVFDGASYVKIDGVDRTGATTLSIQNPNTESAHTIFFTNGATNNTIKNCFVKGASVTKGTATINNAVICFDAQANNGNVIENNDICDIVGQAKPVTMILVNSTTSSASEFNTIDSNNIYNYNYVTGTANGTAAAVHVTGASSNVRVLNNKIYWSGTIADTKAALYGITFDAAYIGAESRVEGNVIGGTTASNSGIASFNSTGNLMPINVNLNSTVKSNTIKNITISTTGASGYMININANGTGLADVNAWTGNTISTIDMTSTVAATLSGLYISASTSTPARNIANNMFNGLKLKTTGNFSAMMRVIYLNSTNAPTAFWSYTGNTIYDIHCDEATETNTHGIIGIDARANTSVIEKNLLYNYKTSNTGTKETILHGIRLNGNNATGSTIKNNIICIGNGVTGSSQIRGIVHSAATTAGQIVNVFHNTVYIGGSQANAVVDYDTRSSAFYRDGGVLPNLTLKNNIFVVTRTSTKAAEGEFMTAIFAATAASNITTSDNNILIAPMCAFVNTNSVIYTTLANWQATTKDTHSSNVDPGFADPTASTPDFHITSANSSANMSGATDVAVTDDFTGAVRADYTPHDMGAYVIAGTTAVEPATYANQTIYGVGKVIHLNNLTGKTAKVFALNGQLLKSFTIKNENETVTMGAGMYIVNAGGENVKVLVK